MPAVIVASPAPTFQDPNLQPIHANATVTTSGSTVLVGYGMTEVALFVNVKATPTGTTPTLTYTLQEVDPGDSTTVIGTTVSSTSINAVSIQKVLLPVVYSGSIQISWTITGTTPSFTQVYATLVGHSTVLQIVDGSGNGPAAIKAPSTTAVAGDPSMVVQLSPNSNGPVNVAQIAGTNTVTGGEAGALGIGGLAAAGSATVGNPVLVAGSDGTDARSLLTDASGRQNIVGAAASGSAVAGNPVLVSGSDGTNARTLSTDTSGHAIVVGGAARGAVPVGNPVLVAGFDGTDVQDISTDTSGRVHIDLATVAGTATVTGGVAGSQGVGGLAATGAAVAGNPVLVAGSDGTDARTISTDTSGRLVSGDGNNNTLTVKNLVAMPSTQGVQPVSGLDAGIINRIIRVSEHGTVQVTSETLEWYDAIEGTTVNGFLTQSVTTQTIAQTAAVLTLNSSGITTLNTDSIITTQRQFAKFPNMVLHWRMDANISANVAANHTLVEMGFGAPAGVTALISNGCFFRWTAAGVLNGVLSHNGTETSTQLLAQGVISTTSYYRYDIFVEDELVRFLVTDNNDVPVVDTQVQLTLTNGSMWAVSHLPSFARVYVDATGGGTVVKLNIAGHVVYKSDLVTEKPWREQQSGAMHHATINPTTYAQTGSTMTAAPATETPSNTVAGYATLGGDFATALTVASENPLSVFAFTIPSPYTFYITQIIFSTPFITTPINVTGIPILEWLAIANCTSGNISTGGGQRFPLGLNMLYTSATQGDGLFLTIGGNLVFTPPTPIACLPGTVLHLAYKVFITSVVTVAGVTRGSVFVDGYFE